MKKIILLTLLAFCFQLSFAQTGKDHRKNERKTERRKIVIKQVKGKKDSPNLSEQTTTQLNKTGYVLENEINRFFDSTGKAKDNDKTEFKYDASWRLKEEILKTWDEGASQTELVSKTEYTRDGMGRIITMLTWIWDDIKKTWVKELKEQTTHNNDSAAERVTIEYLDAKEVPVSKIEYGYDINHYLITDTYYEWNEVTKVYDVIDKIEYTYDAKGNKLTDSYSEWNAGTKKWDVLDKYTNLYDAKDNQIRSLYQEWQVNKFVNSSKDSFTYDLSNNMHINVYAEWDALKSKWTPVEKIENTYDSKRNQTLSMRYVWEARGAGKWVNSYKSESSFDTAYDVSQLILPYDKETIDLHFKTKHLKTWEYSWNKATSVWDSAATTIYNYILQGSTGVRHIQNNSGIEVYPNPADDKVYIKTPNHYGGMEVKIYALAGKLVQSNDMGNLEFINISDLKNGIYFLQISAGQNLLSIKKLIVN